MANIETRLREWAATLWDRELDEEDKDTLFDDLTQAADEIESLMEDLEEERKKHEWVSVKDRLPEQDFREKDNKVAVLLEDGSVDFAHRMAGTTVFVSPSRVYLREVTHWWSLPDPPKEEK